MDQTQLKILMLWHRADDALRTAAERTRDDRGEVTGQTAMIVLLVAAAISAGGIIGAAILANANNLEAPSP